MSIKLQGIALKWGCAIAKKHPPCPPQGGNDGNKHANFKTKNNNRRQPKILISE